MIFLQGVIHDVPKIFRLSERVRDVCRRLRSHEKRLLASYLSACPSGRMYQLGSHWTDVREI
jgi:hypothetical protein